MRGKPVETPQIELPVASAGGQVRSFPIPGKPGLGVLLTEAEARARGLLPPEPKQRLPLLNKLRKQPTVNKG
jgi:hypothetical protein